VFGRGKGQSIIVIIGDEGAYLQLFAGKNLIKRMMVTHEQHDGQEVRDFFADNPKAPISLLLNHAEQTYEKHTLPGVGMMNINQLLAKRLAREFPDADIRDAYLLGRSKGGRKDWIYMFVATKMNRAIKGWLDVALSVPNHINGIYMLPLEASSWSKRLPAIYQAIAKVDSVSDWQLIMTAHKTGGFRQAVYHEGKLMFTRMIRINLDMVSPTIAGDIEQEILNTLDYLRRLSFPEDGTIDVMVVASQGIVGKLDDITILGKPLLGITPHMLASKFDIKQIVDLDACYMDVFSGYMFAQNKPKLEFTTPVLKKLKLLANGGTAVLVATWLITLVMVGIIAWQGYVWFDLNDTISKSSNQERILVTKTKDQDGEIEPSYYSAEQLLDIAHVHRVFEMSSSNPHHILGMLAAGVSGYGIVSSFEWKYDSVLKSNNNTKKKSKKRKKKSIDNEEELQGSESLDVTFIFTNVGENVDSLFVNFDQFTDNITKALSVYRVEHSQLPDTITMDEFKSSVDVQIRIFSDHEDKKKKRR